MSLRTFTYAYIEALIWSETDEDGEPLDKDFGFEDIHKDSLTILRKDCEKFYEAYSLVWFDQYLGDLLNDAIDEDSMAGHDFLLTRNGHGAGFWDGDWEESVEERLAEACKGYGEINLCVGDDGKLHVFP